MHKLISTTLTTLLIAPLAAVLAQESASRLSPIPTFSGPTPGTLRTITIPTVDISAGQAFANVTLPEA